MKTEYACDLIRFRLVLLFVLFYVFLFILFVESVSFWGFGVIMVFLVFLPPPIMSALFENLLRTRSAGTLSHSDLGDNFFLGTGINIMSSPAQCLHSFVKRGGAPFKVVVFGRLSSFEVIEDAVSLFLFLQRVSLCFSPFFLCTSLDISCLSTCANFCQRLVLPRCIIISWKHYKK